MKDTSRSSFRFAIVAIALAWMLSTNPMLPMMIQRQSLANDEPPIYVAIGASDAFGIGTNHPKQDNWPRQLDSLLPQTPHLVNLGIPGATIDLALRAEVPVATAVHPTIITIWLAINDFDAKEDLPTYDAQLRELITTLQRNTTAVIYVGNIPDLTLLPRYASGDLISLRQQVVTWNTTIAQACTETGVTLVDLANDWSDLATHPEYISADGFHPSTVGAQQLAKLFAETMNQSTHPNGAA